MKKVYKKMKLECDDIGGDESLICSGHVLLLNRTSSVIVSSFIVVD